MGEAKRRQYSKEAFLAENQFCCYCPDPAATVDHCPPKAMFPDGKWPEGYDFPSCKRCNDRDRPHEQIVALMLRHSLLRGDSDEKWVRTVQSLVHNRPDLFQEWEEPKRIEQRRELRERFGPQVGDMLRQRDMTIVRIGEQTQRALDEFCLKMAQALFFKHVGRRCTGRVWARRVDLLRSDTAFDKVRKVTPLLAETRRGTESLANRFTYRWNANEEHGAFLALVKCREQFGALICGLDEPLATQFAGSDAASQLIERICPTAAGDEADIQSASIQA